MKTDVNPLLWIQKKNFESFTLSETVKSNKTCSGTKCIGFCSSITEKYLEALRSLCMEGGRRELKQEISLIYFFFLHFSELV